MWYHVRIANGFDFICVETVQDDVKHTYTNDVFSIDNHQSDRFMINFGFLTVEIV